ncbi:MAG: C1 family peptidase [Bacteroidota bacterium]
MRLLLFLLIGFASWNTNLAQTESTDYQTGLIMEDETYEAQPREPKFAGSKYIDLPTKVDLTPYCPYVGNQGPIESCVGWAVGYGALTIQRAIQNNLKDRGAITQGASSALFIYNQVKQNENCQSGSKISDAMAFIAENGDCLARNFDRSIANEDCSAMPNLALQEEASKFAISDFMTLFSIDEDAGTKVLKVQKALANNQPVVIGLKILKNFPSARGVKYWRPTIGNQSFGGGHSVVVVGYDEFKGAFQIMNSWGPEWGENGFIWIKYKDFATYCKYAYVLHLGEKGQDHRPLEVTPVAYEAAPTPPTRPQTPPPTSVPTSNGQLESRIAGGFQFKYLDTSDEMAEPILKNARLSFTGDFYRIERTDWEIGQFFQLVTTSASANEYIYVFSVDAEGQVNIHWPRSAELNPKFAGMNESALVTQSGSAIYIPGKDKGLKLAKKGTEHLCILFSKKKIGNIKAVSDYMQDKKEDFSGALDALLQDYIVPKSEIQFATNRIQFSTSSEQGFIVPIVVELEAR